MSQNTDNKSETLEKRTSDTGLMRVEPQPQTGAVSTGGAEVAVDRARVRQRSRRLRKWLIRLGILSPVVLVIGFFMWRGRRPTVVTVIQPKLTTITETIASSGRVGGETETLVCAQAQGVVEQLNVKEGDTVTAGQRLAVLKNDVAEAQVAQSQ